MESSTELRKFTPTVKAYKNVDFLNSNPARLLRIMCEYEETMARLKRFKISATVLVFGSARAKNGEELSNAIEKAKKVVDETSGVNKVYAQNALDRIVKSAWMGEMSDKISELTKLLTEWGISESCHLGRDRRISGVTRYHYTDPRYAAQTQKREENAPIDGTDPETTNVIHQGVYVCTGGGPGFMEAANKGAASVPGAKNIGMGITLPFETGLNEYVTPELAFEFHYFFTRKFWMVYHCQALVVAPGGFGTLDELFEVLTLKQTGKIQQNLPVVLFGKTYWESIINWQTLVDLGTISQDDVDSLFFTDDPKEAFDYLVEKLSDHTNSNSNVEHEPFHNESLV